MLNVSVIIPTYHDWNRLAICISALEQQSYPQGRFEVIIVNNDPQDPVPNGYYIPLNTKIIVETARGSYAARNAGVKLAKGNILAFTDSDCIPDKNWIKSAVEFFEKEPELHRIGGKVELFCKSEMPNLAEAYDLVYAFKQNLYVRDGGAVTANMIARRKVFECVGLFNDKMYSGGDIDWGHRATLQGFNISYAPETIVKHPARHKIDELVGKARRITSGHKLASERSLIKKYKRLLRLIVLPPIGELKNVFSEDISIRVDKRLGVFFVRYYILLVRTCESIKLHHGSKPYEDA